MKPRLGPTSRFDIRLSQRTHCGRAVVAVMLAVWIGLAGPAIRAQEESSGHGITFTKDFPGSVPAYYSVAVRESGEVVYKTEPEDEQPIEFRLPAEVTSELFSLAGKLSEAPDRPLESERRVANMGEKTIEYRDGAEPFTASFNHTEVPEALALLGLFERISATQQHALRLEYMVQFDRLGVVKALLQLEIDLNNGRLVGASQLISMLERIRNDRAIAQIAKRRAAQILGKIQAESSQLPSN